MRMLSESEEKYRALMEEAPIGFCNVNIKGKITFVNKKFEEVSGYSREEVVGKNGLKLGMFSDETSRLLTKQMKDLLIGKSPRILETQFKCKNGRWIWVEIEGKVIKKLGIPIGFQLTSRNITERKRFEESLSALNNYSRSLNMAESMEEICKLTLDAAEKSLGFEFADILIVEGKMLNLVAHRGFSKNLSLKLPLDGDKGITVRTARTRETVFIPDVRKERTYVEGGEGIRSELAVPIKIGHRILGVLNVESKKLNAFNEKDQKLLEVLAAHAATAISNLQYAKNLEMHAREIRESQEKFERLFMDNPEAAVYVDPDFHILDFNPRFRELFGYSLDEVKGKHIDDIVVPKGKIEEADMLDRKALKGYFYHDTVRKRKDGSLVSVSISVAPIRLEGQLVGCVALYKDITERKQMEKKLEEYSQHLEELVEKRTGQLKETQEQLLKAERLAAIGELAAMVGHDLRNPLTGITAATYYLKTKFGPKMNRKTKEMLELIEKDVEYSNKIISDLIDYSKEIQLDLAETTLKSIIKDTLTLIRVPKSTQVLDLTENEQTIKVDAQKMKRVFVNIIKNAVDAMPKGGKLTIKSKSNGNLEIAFIDTGTGIPNEIMEKIWSPLFTTKAKGMGLGLAICKRIVEAHRGSIFVESTAGKGTTFIVKLPIKPRIEGGEKIWLNMPESLLSTTTKA